MASGRRRGRRVVRDLAMSLVVSIALLVLAEATARWLDLKNGYFLFPTHENCLQRSASLGMELRPNCDGAWTDYVLTGKTGTTFRTNEIGLRTAPLADDGAVRILAMGDSCTWGWAVPQADAYPEVLQRLLNQQFGAGRYRVINGGVPGYTSYQGLVYLRDKGLALHPRIVLIGYGFNDSMANGDVEEDLERQRRALFFVKLDDLLLSRSRLWGWLRTGLRDGFTAAAARPAAAQHPTSPQSPSAPSPATTSEPHAAAPATSVDAPARPPLPQRVPVDKFKRNLTEMIALIRAHGALPFLISFMGPRYAGSPYGPAIAEVGEETSVPVAVYSGSRLDTVHPTSQGYASLAAVLLLRLEMEGYLPRGNQERPG